MTNFRMVPSGLLVLGVLLQATPSSAFAPGALAVGPRLGLRTRHAVSMQEKDQNEADSVPAVRRSFWSRNLSEEQLNKKRYYEIEERGELLAGPDRAEEWGGEMSEIAKWQRTNGPIYVQGGGFGLVVLGFLNYFALGNANGLSSVMWTLSIFVILLGFALQRKTDM